MMGLIHHLSLALFYTCVCFGFRCNSHEAVCEDVSHLELCYYEQSNFDVECFGDCDRSQYSEQKIVVDDIWEDCDGEEELAGR